MNDKEKEMTVIVVLVGHTGAAAKRVVDDLKADFGGEIGSGLIEVIAPPTKFYPNLDRALSTELLSFPDWNHPRVYWRSKQTLDFAFLMNYVYQRFPSGKYFVMLEDDIETKRNFLSEMKNFADRQNNDNWIVISFCQLGFIGKLFRTSQLPHIAQFFTLFYKKFPVDWLLSRYILTSVCNLEKDCKEPQSKAMVHKQPSLFQHIGVQSSLKGKKQLMKDRSFRGSVPKSVPLFVRHPFNPAAKITSTIKPATPNFTIEKAYAGSTFFHGIGGRSGDSIVFQYLSPILLKSYKFKSGNPKYPSFSLDNSTTLELSWTDQKNMTNYDQAKQCLTYEVFDHFHLGEARKQNVNRKVDCLRIMIHKEYKAIVLSEIKIVGK